MVVVARAPLVALVERTLKSWKTHKLREPQDLARGLLP